VHFEGKYELLIIRNKYLKNALNLTEKIANKAQPLFAEALSTKMGQPNKEESKQAEQKQKEQTQQESPRESPPPQNETEDSSEIIEAKKEKKDENLKQVFKKIASKVHPDKLQNLSKFEKDYKTSLFEKARMSLQENDYYGIVEVAEELDIEPPPPTRKQIDLMKNKNQELEQKIKELEDSVLWNWYHGDEETKELLISKYVDRLKKMYPGA